MITNNAERLAEVKACFDNGDTPIGYRRLPGSAIETQDTEVYGQTLSFCAWYDAVPGNQSPGSSALNEQVSRLIEKSPDCVLPINNILWR